MKTLLFSVFALFVFSFSTHAQKPVFTVSEIKQIQQEQRDELKLVQKENWADLIEMQKLETNKTTNSYDSAELFVRQKTERKEILTLQSNERKHLAETQSAERSRTP